jgi:hypothetical protein
MSGSGSLPVIIAQRSRNSRDTVMVKIDQFNGTMVIDIRKWWTSRTGEAHCRRDQNHIRALEGLFRVGEWPRNSRGQTIRVSVRSYGCRPLLDIRMWWTGDDGAVRPVKSFSCRLPRLAQAVTEALKRARMLGLVGDESEGSE